MLQRLRGNNQKGFTLIELMIVIAIIGILAAIAIPQFAAYRIRGFNSSAQSDVRNMATSQAALFADYQGFGGTGTVAAANPLVFTGFAGGDGGLLRGPSGILNDNTVVPVIQITVQARDHGIQLPLGNNVMIVSRTEGAAGFTSFTSASKHVQGDTYFGVDSDTTSIYYDEVTGSSGDLLAVADCPVSVVGEDDFDANGPSGEAWAVR